jgi:ATP-dependent DNA ligase
LRLVHAPPTYILACKEGSRVTLWSRHGTNFTDRLRAGLVAFDLLSLNGAHLRQRPIEERQDELSRVVHGVDNILFSEALSAEGALVFAKACELGLEGIISKRAGSGYRSGNSRQWLKSKNPEFVRE